MLRLRALLLAMVLPTHGPALKKLIQLRAEFQKNPVREGSPNLYPAADGSALPNQQGPAGGWVSAFLRERISELSPPGPPDILPLMQPALPQPPASSAPCSAALCG